MVLTETNNFNEILSEYLHTDSVFYTNISRAYSILERVAEKPLGHGVTLVLMKDHNTSNLEKHLEDAVPYNGRPHHIYDTDITEVVNEKRELDGALLIDPNGQITHAGIGLPFNMPEYKKEYGIEANIGEFMGFDIQNEPPVGLRMRSALYASHEFGDNVVILTLGEGGEINLYYCGDRLYNSAGRTIRWDLAKKMPPTREKILPFHHVKHTETDYSMQLRPSEYIPLAS